MDITSAIISIAADSWIKPWAGVFTALEQKRITTNSGVMEMAFVLNGTEFE